jgi:hypothetical protein
MSRRTALPDALAGWIRTHLPALGDPHRIRLRVRERIPFWWIPGNKNACGLTLGNRIYLRAEYCPIDPANREAVQLVFHELAHVMQFREKPLLFPIRYLLQHIRYGYTGNPAEGEARQFAMRNTEQYFRDFRKLAESGPRIEPMSL